MSVFEAGQRIDVSGSSKGKGTAGVIKRHGFKGLGASHGTQRKHRSPGSIGAAPRRAGCSRAEDGRPDGQRARPPCEPDVHAIDAEKGLLLIKGAVPGPNGGLVLVRKRARREDGER